MPRCEYCGTIPFATYCPSYFVHLERCKLAYEKGGKKQSTESKKPTHITNIQNITINNFKVENNMVYNHQQISTYSPIVYLDYPKNEFTTKCIEFTSTVNIEGIRNEDDIDKFLDCIQEAEGRKIASALESTNIRDISSAYSLLANVVRVLKGRLSPFTQPKAIEILNQLEKDILDEKSKLSSDKSLVSPGNPPTGLVIEEII